MYRNNNLTNIEKAKIVYYRLTGNYSKDSYSINEIQKFSELFDMYIGENYISEDKIYVGKNELNMIINEILNSLNEDVSRMRYKNNVDNQVNSYEPMYEKDRYGNQRELSATEMFYMENIDDEFDELSMDNEYMFETEDEREERRQKYINDKLGW